MGSHRVARINSPCILNTAYAKRKQAHPSLSLPFPSLIRERNLFTAALTVFQSLIGPSRIQTLDMRHNRASLTNQPRVLMVYQKGKTYQYRSTYKKVHHKIQYFIDPPVFSISRWTDKVYRSIKLNNRCTYKSIGV